MSVSDVAGYSYEKGLKDGARAERERVLRLIRTLTAGGFSAGQDAQRTLKALEENIRGEEVPTESAGVRKCEYEACAAVLPPGHTAVYCSNQCAAADA